MAVGENAEAGNLRSCEQRRQQGAVAGAEGTGLQLISYGKDGNAKPTKGFDMRDPGRSQQGSGSGIETRARFEQDSAFGIVLAPGTDIGAALQQGAQPDFVLLLAALLAHSDGIAAVRHARAGGDGDALAEPNTALKGLSRGRCPNQLQRRATARAEGKTVHGGAREGRHGDGRDCVACENASRRMVQ